jgi:hypothetical protein
VGHPTAVNPDKELRSVAQSRGWPILEFERAVTLRTRLETIPAPVPVISGAAVAAGVATGVAVWMLRARRKAG